MPTRARVQVRARAFHTTHTTYSDAHTHTYTWSATGVGSPVVNEFLKRPVTCARVYGGVGGLAECACVRACPCARACRGVVERGIIGSFLFHCRRSCLLNADRGAAVLEHLVHIEALHVDAGQRRRQRFRQSLGGTLAALLLLGVGGWVHVLVRCVRMGGWVGARTRARARVCVPSWR